MKSISAFLRLDISATTHPPFNGLFSRTACVSRYQIGKTSVDLNEARDGGVWGCSCISWTIILQTMCTSLQVVTQTPHHSLLTDRILFLTAQPTVSKH